MPLLKPTKKTEKEKVKLSLSKDVMSCLNQYCEWAGFDSQDDFVEQAICHVFKKDKAWQTHSTNANLNEKRIPHE